MSPSFFFLVIIPIRQEIRPRKSFKKVSKNQKNQKSFKNQKKFYLEEKMIFFLSSFFFLKILKIFLKNFFVTFYEKKIKILSLFKNFKNFFARKKISRRIFDKKFFSILKKIFIRPNSKNDPVRCF